MNELLGENCSFFCLFVFFTSINIKLTLYQVFTVPNTGNTKMKIKALAFEKLLGSLTRHHGDRAIFWGRGAIELFCPPRRYLFYPCQGLNATRSLPFTFMLLF